MFEIFEIIVIAVIIIIQVIVFWKTLERIRHMKSIIPWMGYSVKLVSLEPLKAVTVDDHLPEKIKGQVAEENHVVEDEDEEDEQYTDEANNEQFSDEDDFPISENFGGKREIPQLFVSNTTSKEFISIKDVINGWTLKNGGIPPEISQIKEYVEERLQAIEQDVHLTIPVPLYLGLLGTMFGIILGLFSMPDISVENSPKNLDMGIAELLKGVKYAMTASIAGLLFMLINSGWFFKRSKIELQSRMDKFLTFLRIDFHLSYSSSGLDSIAQAQNNMTQFIIDFSQNLSVLDGLFKKNYDTLVYQSGLLDKLEKIDVNKFAKTNIDVLQAPHRSRTPREALVRPHRDQRTPGQRDRRSPPCLRAEQGPQAPRGRARERRVAQARLRAGRCPDPPLLCRAAAPHPGAELDQPAPRHARARARPAARLRQRLALPQGRRAAGG